MRTTLLFVFLLLAGMLTAQTIENPTFKARAGNINTITKIERTPEVTKLYIHAVFRPNWWITEDSKEYLEDVATGKKYMITGSEGIELDKQTYMPESGEMDFVLHFAPLPEETKEIHWLEPGSSEANTFNISLIAPAKKDRNPLELVKGNWLTDDALNEWKFGIYDSLMIMDNRIYSYENIRKKGKSLELILKDKRNGETETLCLTPRKDGNCFIQKGAGKKELFTKKEKQVRTIRPESDFTQFFHPDTAYLQGYIDGYDPRLGFETGLVYLSNEITREDYPTVVTIHPDGSFEGKFKMNHPKKTAIVLGSNWIPFYVEPGQTLTVYLDWEAIMARSRSRDPYFPIKNTLYMGPSAEIARVLKNSEPLLEYHYEKLAKAQKELSPSQFKEQMKNQFAKWDQITDSLVQIYQSSAKAARLLKNETALKEGSLLFDFLTNREYYAKEDTANQVLKIKEDESYYDFLKTMPLNDVTTLASEKAGTFINRFEYMDPLRKAYSVRSNPQPDSIMYTYDKTSILTFFKEKGVKLNADQETLRQKQEALAGQKIMRKKADIEAEFKIMRELYSKEQKLVKEYYSEKYNGEVVELSQDKKDELYASGQAATTSRKDSIIQLICGMEQPFLGQLANVRSLSFDLKTIQTDSIAREYLDNIKKGIDNPFLLSEAERLFAINHPDEAMQTYQLPAGKATEIFRNIIKAHQGKVLYVDFWATFCGPCRYGIEHTADLREKYKDHPEFQFIYITSVKDSPSGAYNSYVEKNLKGEACYRVSETEFNYLRELFHFNGIPHYELVEKDGSVCKKAPDSHELNSYLNERFRVND